MPFMLQEMLFSTTNANEGLFFTVPFSTDTTLGIYVQNLIPSLNSTAIQLLVDAYTNLGLDGNDAVSLLVGEGLLYYVTTSRQISHLYTL